MKTRITVRDIAREVRLHYTTVARALKNDPRIAPATRAKVQTAGARLGYSPDPMMAAFASYRQKNRIPKFQGTIAWVTNHPTRDGWHSIAANAYCAGAKTEAQALGYQLEEFWLRQELMSARRASQILFSRGIRGLLLAPQPISRGHLSIRWEEFSAISFGFSMVRPHLNLVAPAHFRAVVTCFRHLRAMGHRRIAMACEHSIDERNDRLWISGFRSEQEHLPESAAIPLLTPERFEKRQLLDWYRAYRPTAIITSDRFPRCCEWLRKAGVRIPRDVSIALLNKGSNMQRWGGIDEQSLLIGANAVKLLTGMLARGERGLPEAPMHVLVEGKWSDGPTVSYPSSAPATSRTKCNL